MKEISGETVQYLLKSQRAIQSEEKMLLQQLVFLPENNSHLKENIQKNKFLLAVIDIWLTFLNQEEVFLLQRHLIDDIDWARVMVEYERLWDKENGRSERTLKRKQAQAIEKLCHYSNQEFPKAFLRILESYEPFILKERMKI